MEIDVKSAVAEIESTTDLLGRMADAAERKVVLIEITYIVCYIMVVAVL